MAKTYFMLYVFIVIILFGGFILFSSSMSVGSVIEGSIINEMFNLWTSNNNSVIPKNNLSVNSTGYILKGVLITNWNDLAFNISTGNLTYYYNKTESDARYLKNESDPTFSSWSYKSTVEDNSGYWDEAYSWGDHSTYGYLTSESDSLSSVVSRGSSTSSSITIGGLVASGNIRPSANDGQALGSTSYQFSDLFLASGGVINWNNGNTLLTQSSTRLTLKGGFTSYQDTVSTNDFETYSSAYSYYRPVVRFNRGRGTKSTPDTTLNGDFIGDFEFRGTYGTALSTYSMGGFGAIQSGNHTSSTVSIGDLYFSTNSGSGGNVVERIRIKSDGKIGIGTSSPKALFNPLSTSTQIRQSYSTSVYMNSTVDSSNDLTQQLTGDGQFHFKNLTGYTDIHVHDIIYHTSHYNGTYKEAYDLVNFAMNNFVNKDGTYNYSAWGECMIANNVTDLTKPKTSKKTHYIINYVIGNNELQGIEYADDKSYLLAIQEAITKEIPALEGIVDEPIIIYPHTIIEYGISSECRSDAIAKANEYQKLSGRTIELENGDYALDMDTAFVENLYFESLEIPSNISFVDLFSSRLPYIDKHTKPETEILELKNNDLKLGNNVEKAINNLAGYILINEYCRKTSKDNFKTYNYCMNSGLTINKIS